MGYDIVEEEGSVELDESELFLDDDESLINLGCIVGGGGGAGAGVDFSSATDQSNIIIDPCESMKSSYNL